MLYYPHMNTTNAKIMLNIAYILFLTAILVLGVATMPSDASAQTGGYKKYSDGHIYFVGWKNTKTNYRPEETYPIYEAPEPEPTPIVYSTTTNQNTVQPAKAAPKKAAPKAKAAQADIGPGEEVTEKYTDLAASAIFGANSFIPSRFI